MQKVMSEEELIDLIRFNLEAWAQEEVELNDPCDIDFDQRFIENAQSLCTAIMVQIFGGE